jgi:hypothetical protein
MQRPAIIAGLFVWGTFVTTCSLVTPALSRGPFLGRTNVETMHNPAPLQRRHDGSRLKAGMTCGVYMRTRCLS